MPNTYTSLHYHFVFATKRRERLIAPAIESRVWEYLAGIAKQNRMHPHQIGGVEDHIHAAIDYPSTIAISKATQLLKGSRATRRSGFTRRFQPCAALPGKMATEHSR